VANINDWIVPVLTCIGTIFAGAGLKWIEAKLKKAKDKDDTATNLRNELRAELTALKQEMQQVEKELDEWKTKYFEAYEQLLMLRVQLEQARRLLESKGERLPEPPPHMGAQKDLPPIPSA
jgi:uncharacterized protein (DUF3084 family)